MGPSAGFFGLLLFLFSRDFETSPHFGEAIDRVLFAPTSLLFQDGQTFYSFEDVSNPRKPGTDFKTGMNGHRMFSQNWIFNLEKPPQGNLLQGQV